MQKCATVAANTAVIVSLVFMLLTVLGIPTFLSPPSRSMEARPTFLVWETSVNSTREEMSSQEIIARVLLQACEQSMIDDQLQQMINERLALRPVDWILRIALTRGSERCRAVAMGYLHCQASWSSWIAAKNSKASLVEALRIFGSSVLGDWMPSGCVQSVFVRTLSAYVCGTTGRCNRTASDPGTPGDEVARRQLSLPRSDATPSFRPFVPVKERHIPPYSPALQCDNIPDVVLQPISFAMPRSSIVEKVSRNKIFDFSLLYPKGRGKDYRYTIDEEYAMLWELRHSLFSLTSKRYGWDCYRHYEILAAGCVPYFVDLNLAPSYTISALPQKMLQRVLKLPALKENGYLLKDSPQMNTSVFQYHGTTKGHFGETNVDFISRGTVDWTRFSIDEYWAIADELLDFTKKYLSTQSLAAYLLNRTGNAHARRVLIIQDVDYPDFLFNCVLHGMYDLGLNVTVYTSNKKYFACINGKNVRTLKRLERIRYERLATWHGRGYHFGFSIPEDFVEFIEPETNSSASLHKRIAEHPFDAVVFSYLAGFRRVQELPYFEDVRAAMRKESILFVDGFDDSFENPLFINRIEAANYGHMFVRELHKSPNGECEKLPEGYLPPNTTNKKELLFKLLL